MESRQLFAADVFAFSVSDSPQPVVVWEPTPKDLLAQYVLQGGSTGGIWRPMSPLSLETFNSPTDLDAKLAPLVTQYWADIFDKPLSDIGQSRFWYPWRHEIAVFSGVQLSSAALTPETSNSAGTTNVQLASVDEADVIELTVDGYLYTVGSDGLKVIDLRDPANVVASAVAADQGQPESSFNTRLFVVGDRLVKLSGVSAVRAIYDTSLTADGSKTRIEIFDIRERLNPQLISTTDVEGYTQAARMIGGQLTLVQSNSLPLILPQPLVVMQSDGTERYESAASYLARNRAELVKAIVPDYGQGDTVQDVGTWDDVSIAAPQLYSRTSVMRFDVQAAQPELIDSEVILGLDNINVFMTPESVYLYSNRGSETVIYRLQSQSDSQLKIVSQVSVPGAIFDSRWMSEENGVLRVATRGGNTAPLIRVLTVQPEPFWPGDEAATNPNQVESSGGANIYTIGNTDSGWQIIGRLEDLAAGQILLGAYFDGDRALLTTGEQNEFGWNYDPLHGIDLSDPANPQELSELVIPGFTTYLHRIDATHWFGLGWVETESRWSGALQVSLYEAADLANLRVVDTWVSPNVQVMPGMVLNALGIQYDAASGLLTIGGSSITLFPNDQGRFAPPVLKIDLTADKPLSAVELIDYPESPERMFVYAEHLVAISQNAVFTSPLDQLGSPPNVTLIPSQRAAERYQYIEVEAGQTTIVSLIDGWGTELFTVESVSDGVDLTAHVLENNRLRVNAAALQYSTNETLTVRIRYVDGQTATLYVAVYINGPEGWPLPVPTPQFSNARASILSRFEDDAGQSVTSLQAGDEVWVVVSAQDRRDFGSGVYGAYFDVVFNSSNISVVGEIEHLGEFVNGRRGSVTTSGILAMGGFGDAQVDSTEPQDIVRFRIRVNDDSPVTMTFTPSPGVADEFLLHGENARLHVDNIDTSTLTTGPELLRAAGEASAHDINADGAITGLDALLIINYINAHNDAPATAAATFGSSLAAYDLNGDGAVTGVDVLQVVNVINSRLNSQSSGEGEATSAPVDVALQQLYAPEVSNELTRAKRAWL